VCAAPERPDGIGPVGCECRVVHADDPAKEGLEQFRGAARLVERAELVGQSHVPVHDVRRRGCPLVRDDAGDGVGQQRRAEGAATTVRVADHRHARRVVAGERLGDGRDILELALDRVRLGVTRRAASAAIDGVDAVPLREGGPDDTERGVIRGGAVDEHQRRADPAAEHGDRRAVGRGDDPGRRGRSGHGHPDRQR
jgi:hypothetical protein